MKTRFFLFIIVVASVSVAFSIAKGKKDPPPSDGVERKWKTTPVKPKNQQTVKLACGIEYTVISKGNGPLPKPGDDRVLALYKGWLTADTGKVFDASSNHGNVPYGFHPGRGGEVIAGWDSAFKYLHGGDIAIINIPAKYGYGAAQRPGIPANSDLTFRVEVIDVIAKPVQWSAKGKDTITTPSGLKMVMFETHPENPMPQRGQTVSVDYSGYLLNGYMFDSSVDKGQPLVYQHGIMPVIAGWQEGVGLMHKGEKAQLIIPYQLGYGAQGRPPIIPAKADLIFDIHLVDIK